MAFWVQHSSGWAIAVLDAAMNHLTDQEVRAVLETPQVCQEIEAASATGAILHWNGGAGYGQIVLPAGIRILIRHASPLGGDFVNDGSVALGSAQLVVFHADRGDGYKAENYQKMLNRFAGSGAGGGGGVMAE